MSWERSSRGSHGQGREAVVTSACSLLSPELVSLGKSGKQVAELKGNDLTVAPGQIRAQHSENRLSSHTEG